MNLSFIKNDYSDASSAYYGGQLGSDHQAVEFDRSWIVARYDDGHLGHNFRRQSPLPG